MQARYIRGTFDNKPYTLGKYESTRIRVAIAELAANGGAAMGFYMGRAKLGRGRYGSTVTRAPSSSRHGTARSHATTAGT